MYDLTYSLTNIILQIEKYKKKIEIKIRPKWMVLKYVQHFLNFIY